MSNGNLTKKLKGKLVLPGYPLDRYYAEPILESIREQIFYGKNIGVVIGALAARAGYKIGDEFEYEIRITKKRID